VDEIPFESEFDDLKDRIISLISSQSLKSIWESSCHIDSVQDSILVVYVIENGKMILLNMGKNKQDLEKLVSDIL